MVIRQPNPRQQYAKRKAKGFASTCLWTKAAKLKKARSKLKARGQTMSEYLNAAIDLLVADGA